MKQLIFFLVAFYLNLTCNAQPPNNPIFGGGNADGVDKTSFAQAGTNIFNGGQGDGFDKTAFSQAGTNIFNGGSGDGFDKTSFAQAATNIFKGGEADGWSFTSFAQASTNIYKGGDGDGWSFNSFAQAANNIYNGGNADGWSFTNFAQAGNNIFFGGVGDGWASTYRPLGPLPITILSFEAKKQNAKVQLDWIVNNAINFSKFEIERSNNAISFVKIGTVNGSSSIGYNFKDAFPSKGNNYYRLKLLDIDGKFTYTPVRVVDFGDDENVISVYPNPVVAQTKLVLSASMMSEPLVLNVINSIGQVVYHQRIGANTQSIVPLDFSRLAAGTYMLHLRGNTINITGRVIKQ